MVSLFLASVHTCFARGALTFFLAGNKVDFTGFLFFSEHYVESQVAFFDNIGFLIFLEAYSLLVKCMCYEAISSVFES